MNFKKLISATLASTVVMWLLAGLWHMIIIPEFYDSGHKTNHEGTGIIIVAYLVLGFLMAYIYSLVIKNGRPMPMGLKFGILIGILWVFPHELAMAGAHGESISYVFKNAGWHLIEQGIGGIMIALIYGDYEKVNRDGKNLGSKKIKDIYSGRVVKTYDLPISHMFKEFKKQAFLDSALKTGDKVLVFCCGSGLDFPYIIEKIGDKGKIVGIDFSSEMLKKAKKKILTNNWKNIELIEADVTTFQNNVHNSFDVGICTLGLSIIPDYKTAFYNLHSSVKADGEIIIGDMQLATGKYSIFNTLTIFLAKRFGGTFEGHQNSSELYSIMKKELIDLRRKEFFLKSYYICIGKKPISPK
jgi:ubiquinone/menaquinone biosynthesis C-methylase UbiE